MATVTAKRELVPLSGACRVTCRTSAVLKAWHRAGCFAKDEWVVDESRVQGGGHPTLVDICALEREHRRHGGTEWHPHLAHARNLPHMGAYVDDLRARLHALEAELARMRQRGGTAVVRPVQARDRDAAVTRPALARARSSSSRPRPRPTASGDEYDFLPVREDGDRPVSVNKFSEAHGISHSQAATWYQAVNDGRFENVVDARQVQGKYWSRGRLTVRYIIYHEGRDEFLPRYWHLPYVGSCGRPGCECAEMPPKDGEGKIIDLNAWERVRWKQQRRVRARV